MKIGKKKLTTKEMTIVGIMVAITVIMDYTIGVIPLPMVSATIVHIPAVITGMVVGPFAGFIVGTAMGIESLIHAVTRPPSPLAPLFFNPIVSILPRMFIGVVAYYVYAGLKKALEKWKAGEPVSIFIGAAAGSLTNTVGVLAALYFVYAAQIEEILQTVTAKSFVVLVATTNGLAEMIVSGIISVPVVMALLKIKKS